MPEPDSIVSEIGAGMKRRWNWRRKSGVCFSIENDIKMGIPEETAIRAATARTTVPLEEVKEWLYRYRKFGSLSLRRSSNSLRTNHGPIHEHHEPQSGRSRYATDKRSP